MSGWITSTNKGALIALLTHRDAEMKTLREQFEKETEKSLVKVLKDECSGEFEDALVALARGVQLGSLQVRHAPAPSLVRERHLGLWSLLFPRGKSSAPNA